MTESTEKLGLIRTYLKQHKLDAVVFSTRSNFAWVTGGGDNHVVSQIETGFGALVISAKDAWLVANAIEAPRLQAEEPVSAFTPKIFPWTTSLGQAVCKLVDKKNVVCDDPEALGLPPLPETFRDTIRAQLSVAEMRRYRLLGNDCSLVVETVARHLSIGDSGCQVEADLARHLLARGIQPNVLLVAFDDRLKRYRHPIPSLDHLRHYGMIVVCGRRKGLIANLTRLVHFGPIPNDLQARHLACCRVEAALWSASKPGTTWGQALTAGISQYQAEGFPDEWTLHHQGGPTGYSGRDFLATPDDARPILDRQAVAWNPSITGTKSEDTFIIHGEERDVVTACTGAWPTLEIVLPNGFKVVRPAILQR